MGIVGAAFGVAALVGISDRIEPAANSCLRRKHVLAQERPTRPEIYDHFPFFTSRDGQRGQEVRPSPAEFDAPDHPRLHLRLPNLGGDRHVSRLQRDPSPEHVSGRARVSWAMEPSGCTMKAMGVPGRGVMLTRIR